jgi:hypothetical protein
MLRNTAIGLAAVALTLATAALSPASANYASCTENPEGNGCPGSLAPISPQSSSERAPATHVQHAHNYRGSRPATKG